MGRKLVKKPTVGHLWTVSPLPLPSIPMLSPTSDLVCGAPLNESPLLMRPRPLVEPPLNESSSLSLPLSPAVYQITAHGSSSAGLTGVPVSRLSPENERSRVQKTRRKMISTQFPVSSFVFFFVAASCFYFRCKLPQSLPVTSYQLVYTSYQLPVTS